MVYGSDIKRRREELGISLRKLAEIADISPSYLSRIESGKRSAPDKYILQRIEDALKNEDEAFREMEVKEEIYSYYGSSKKIEMMLEELCKKIRRYNKKGDISIEEMTKLMEEINKIIKT